MKDLPNGADSRQAAWTLAAADISMRNAALLAMARRRNEQKDAIFAETMRTLPRGRPTAFAAPLLKRLAFREEKLFRRHRGLKALATLPDPIGQTPYAKEADGGLEALPVPAPSA